MLACFPTGIYSLSFGLCLSLDVFSTISMYVCFSCFPYCCVLLKKCFPYYFSFTFILVYLKRCFHIEVFYTKFLAHISIEIWSLFSVGRWPEIKKVRRSQTFFVSF